MCAGREHEGIIYWVCKLNVEKGGNEILYNRVTERTGEGKSHLPLQINRGVSYKRRLLG